MEKAAAIPAVLVRGYKYEPCEGSAKPLIRPAEADLFR
jgi:F420-0:gamma-glutamyl ligase